MKAFLSVAVLATAVHASGCKNVIAPSYNTPVVSGGWTAQIVANGLSKPRSIQFDGSGGLLVLESGKGVSRVVFKDNGGSCLEVESYTSVVNKTTLNHGMALSNDGDILYASSAEAVYAWAYDAKTGTVSGEPTTVVANMSNSYLTTRTLLISQKQTHTLLVSRGSSEDFDANALDAATGVSQIRAFDLSSLTSSSKRASASPFSFETAGIRLGWGLRNSVGLAEHPISGGIYSVENSIDSAVREGVDIHQTNPGEELNYHGILGSLSASYEGANYGYPNCFAVWDTAIPDNATLSVGDQVSLTQNSTLNDADCAANYTSPRLTFPAHMAPLDLLFSSDGSEAYVTFHGSVDKTNPVGYSVATIAFNSTSGAPVEPSTSNNALTNILSNPDLSVCPGSCFRPVGLSWDSSSRLFVSSDKTGEIFVLVKSSATATATSSGTMVTATGSSGAAGTGLSQTTSLLAFALAGLVATFVQCF